MKTFNKLTVKVTKTTLETSFNNAATLAQDLTNVACSGVVNFYETGSSASLCGHIANVCNHHKEGAKIVKITNATRAFINKFVAIQPKRDKVTKEIQKIGVNTVYQVNQSKLDKINATALEFGVDTSNKAEMVEYITNLMNEELKSLGGTILGKKDSNAWKIGLTPEQVDIELHNRKLVSFEQSCISAFKSMTSLEIQVILKKSKISETIDALEVFQAEVTAKQTKKAA